jgi:hypothetical protein
MARQPGPTASEVESSQLVDVIAKLRGSTMYRPIFLGSVLVKNQSQYF